MKKKAFTLTELLVVVVIIGVLSAVVLPKFTKILQTRKTTEAENVMAAVRNEQEARCMVGRNYTADTTKLASLPKATSKNYTYSLDAQGITATAKDGEYELQIPSYTDGRICCKGEGCDALNKDYPKCEENFLKTLDKATCEATESCVSGSTRNVISACGQESGEKCEGGNWVSYTNTIPFTEEEKQDCTKCDGPWPENNRDCPEGYNGSQSRPVSCDKSTGRWSVGEWEGMETCAQEADCEEDATRGHEPYTECMGGCGEYVDVCYGGSEWQPECRWKASTECTGNNTKTETVIRDKKPYKVTYQCENCKWVEKSVECGAGYEEKEKGVCCLKEQISKNGQCMYAYRPQHTEINVLAICHGSDYDITGTHKVPFSYAYLCGVKGYQYFKGGSAPRVDWAPTIPGIIHEYASGIPAQNPAASVSGCSMHIAYYWDSDKMWKDGEQVYPSALPDGKTEQEFCDMMCGNQPQCSVVGALENMRPITQCTSYRCTNGWHCDNATTTISAVECVRI